MQEYIVKKDDILGRIAQQFNISLQNLLKLNPEIEDPDKIFVGQKIKVPASGGAGRGKGKRSVSTGREDGGGGQTYITKEEYINHYLEEATLSAMATGEYMSKRNSLMTSTKWLYRRYTAPLNKELEKKTKFLDSLEGPVLDKYRKELSKIIDGIDETERYFTRDPQNYLKDRMIAPETESTFFSVDLELMSMLEIGVAYGVDLLPESISPDGEGTLAPGRNFKIAMMKKSEQIRKKLNLGPKPKPYWKNVLDKEHKHYNRDFSKAWNKAAQDFRSSPPIKEDNAKQSITEFFRKNKTQTAEEFFEIDKMGSKGAQGLICKMLDVMTPDVNIEYKGRGQEQADAVGYVQDYIKNSFLGMIDSEPSRGDNENADFAKHMDSESWGENINFDTLIQATKELYEYAGNFFDETQSGSETGSQQETVVTLGANTIPVLLLFHCLKYLGSSLFKMRKRYNKKRGQPMKENKIIQEYILKNTPQPPKDASVTEIIADEVNEVLNNLLNEYGLRPPFRNTKENREQKKRVKKWLKSQISNRAAPWFDFFRTMRFEEETAESFKAVFLARQGLNKDSIEPEFSRRQATKTLKVAFSPERGDTDLVFKKYEKEMLNKLFAFYGCYVLEDIDFDSRGNLTLEFEWLGAVEGIVSAIETGEQYDMSMKARNAQQEKAAAEAEKEFRKSKDTKEGNIIANADKIIQEYILKNTPKPHKDASIIEIIVDEVNEVLNNLPEIKLASEILSEDELKNLFSPLAKEVVLNIHGKMQEHIKNLVEIEIPPAVVAQLLRGEDLDPQIRQELEAAIGAAEVESGEVDA